MNPASAHEALEHYAAQPRPGYALLVEGPWGAGKTHLVKGTFESRVEDQTARYISLAGVSDEAAFRRALGGFMTKKDWAGVLGDFAPKLKGLGNLASQYYEDFRLENLPGLLIFDDLERCALPASQLLGHLNELVEHREKNVVLCANVEQTKRADADAWQKDFKAHKEKVIGRTLRIEPDTAAALSAFFEDLPEGAGRNWLTEHRQLVVDTFEQAKHGNLRVLRQALRESAWLVNVLEDDLRAATGAMQRLVRTQLALSMALAVGRIAPEDFAQRTNYLAGLSSSSPSPSSDRLKELEKQHPGADIRAIISKDLALPEPLGQRLIANGYEAPEEINKALRDTGQFVSREMPLWQRLADWPSLPAADLETAYDEAERYLFDNDDIEPGPFLSVALNRLWIASSSRDISEERDRILKRIDDLATAGRIPPSYGQPYLGPGYEDRFAYGGYSIGLDETTKPIVEMMSKCRTEAWERTRPKEGKKLLDLLRENPERFVAALTDEVPILDTIDPAKFSRALAQHSAEGKFELMARISDHLLGRVRSADRFAPEREWGKEVRRALEALAQDPQTHETERARIRLLVLRRGLFNEPDQTTGS